MSDSRFVWQSVVVAVAVVFCPVLQAGEASHQCKLDMSSGARVDETPLRGKSASDHAVASIPMQTMHVISDPAVKTFLQKREKTLGVNVPSIEQMMVNAQATLGRASHGGGGGGADSGVVTGFSAIAGMGGASVPSGGMGGIGNPGGGMPGFHDGGSSDLGGGHVFSGTLRSGTPSDAENSIDDSPWRSKVKTLDDSVGKTEGPPAKSPRTMVEHATSNESVASVLRNVAPGVAMGFSNRLNPNCKASLVNPLNSLAGDVSTMDISRAQAVTQLHKGSNEADYVSKSRDVLKDCFDSSVPTGEDDFVRKHHLMQMLGTLDLNGVPICTALLINPSSILTAKHCFISESGTSPLPPELLAGMSFVLADQSQSFDVCALVGSNALADYNENLVANDQVVARIAEGARLPEKVAVLLVEDLAVAVPETGQASSLTALAAYSFMPSAHLVDPATFTNGFVKSNDGMCFPVTKNRVCAEHLCGAVQGGSGAPVFAKDLAALTLVGIHVGGSTGYTDCPAAMRTSNVIVFPNKIVLGQTSL